MLYAYLEFVIGAVLSFCYNAELGVCCRSCIGSKRYVRLSLENSRTLSILSTQLRIQHLQQTPNIAHTTNSQLQKICCCPLTLRNSHL